VAARKLEPDEVREFLSLRGRTGKLATTRKDGAPHVVPIWFVMDGEDVVFTIGTDDLKAHNLRRDPRACLCVDDERPPFSYVQVNGTVEMADSPPDMLEWTTRIAGRYMGVDQAEAYGKRNAMPGELLVRLRPTKILALADIAA
jgi:PPOX class probable F420-dependent enzyme